MFKRIRQYNYIKKIRATMASPSMFKYLELNTYKQSAARDVFTNRISEKFYKEIFYGGTISHHYTEVNAEAIKNYKF